MAGAMNKRQSLTLLYSELMYYITITKKDDDNHFDSTGEFISKRRAKQEIRKLQSRIANRERYDAMRSMGLTKTPHGWE